MASKFFKAFNFFKKKSNTSKIAPDIKQPRQLKQTMEKIRSENKKFGFTKAKTAVDRANIVRTKKSIERMNKVDELKKKRKEGIKASKEMKKMVDTKQAEKVGGTVYPHHVRERKFMGGLMGKKKPKSKEEIKKITSSDAYKKADYKTKTKMLGGNVSTRKEMEEKIKKQKPRDSIKEKIAPKKKMDRLKELRKDLGMKKGGKAKFPDLTGDGKVTRADILKGRGVFRKGGASK